MSQFKDMLKEDLEIFINIEEMGERVTINEKDYQGVLEHPNNEFTGEYEGITEAIALIVYLQEQEEFKKFKTGKAIEINNSTYIINNTYVEEGLRIIRLTENRGY